MLVSDICCCKCRLISWYSARVTEAWLALRCGQSDRDVRKEVLRLSLTGFHLIAITIKTRR